MSDAIADAVLSLRRAVHGHLAADAALTALIGTARIHDEPPRAASGVYVVFGDAEALDWSTGTDRGCEQTFRLVVWAAETGSVVLALQAAMRIEALLHEAELALVGHRLINLRATETGIVRDAKTNLQRITLTFRVVTEAA
jgi:hypothetical protein